MSNVTTGSQKGQKGQDPKAQEGMRATVRYVDRPECVETFANSINSVFFDGQTMRLEFGITRMDDHRECKRSPAEISLCEPVPLLTRIDSIGDRGAVAWFSEHGSESLS